MWKGSVGLFRWIIGVLLLLCGVGSQQRILTSPIHGLHSLGFYYFRTTMDLDDAYMQSLQAVAPAEMVVRLFDVDLDRRTGKAIPLAPIRIANRAKGRIRHLKDVRWSGLVYITNRSIQALDPGAIDSLAKNIVKKSIFMADGMGVKMETLQMDCDWSLSTREVYFRLLEEMRPLLNDRGVKLVATIRLHQIKYREKTGVPPVDRGILMFYNMSDPGLWKTENSILDLSVARKYLGRLDSYPLPLDMALPLYSQVVVFDGDHIVGILSGVLSHPENRGDCFESVGIHRYKVIKRCLLRSNSGGKIDVAPGWRLRYEHVTEPDLREALGLLEVRMSRSKTIYLYDFQSFRADFPRIRKILE